MYKALHAYVRRNLQGVYGAENIRDQLYKNMSSWIIDSWRLFSGEFGFPKTFSLSENQFSGKTHFYTIGSSKTGPMPANVLGDMWGRFWNSLYQHMVPYPDAASVDPSEELKKQASNTGRSIWIPCIQVFHRLLKRWHTKNRKSSSKQHIKILLLQE